MLCLVNLDALTERIFDRQTYLLYRYDLRTGGQLRQPRVAPSRGGCGRERGEVWTREGAARRSLSRQIPRYSKSDPAHTQESAQLCRVESSVGFFEQASTIRLMCGLRLHFRS